MIAPGTFARFFALVLAGDLLDTIGGPRFDGPIDVGGLARVRESR